MSIPDFIAQHSTIITGIVGLIANITTIIYYRRKRVNKLHEIGIKVDNMGETLKTLEQIRKRDMKEIRKDMRELRKYYFKGNHTKSSNQERLASDGPSKTPIADQTPQNQETQRTSD